MIPSSSPRHLYMSGMAIGLQPLGLLFDVNCPCTGCRICGAVFQSDLDRLPNRDFEAMQLRKAWSIEHAKRHSDLEHLTLAKSGMWATPEAAQRFAAYGIIALSDMILSEEHADALMNAKSIPIDDVEGRHKGIVL